jgi:photosystem II stability/assembly factor-like uncharacterized protein
MRRGRLFLGFLLAVTGCDDDDGDSGSDGTTTSDAPSEESTTEDPPTEPEPPMPYWAVGEEGEMLRIDQDGAAGGYPLEEDADLLAIDCLGSHIAWAAGDDGTVLRTLDAGETWKRVDLGISDTLRGIRVVNQHLAYVVGDAGTIRLTRDGGATWTSVEAPPVDFSAIATDIQGRVALMTALDGSIWRHDEGATQVDRVGDALPTSLHGVSVTEDGLEAVAVGELGVWLESEDGGRHWTARDVGTVRDLHAVQLARRGGLAIAVGEAGTIVRVDSQGASATEALDEALSLHAVHASASGEGIAVGDHGVVLITDDLADWWAAEPATTMALFGVDGLGVHPHL